MRLLGKHISALVESDLIELVSSGVVESQVVEYKLSLPGSNDIEKRAFLSDVTAMANTAGGIILYGIATRRDDADRDTGVPAAVPGLADLNFDKERLRLEAILRSAVSPPITSQAHVQDIRLASGSSVVAIGIARSYLAPHRVTFGGINRFHRRSQGGNYEPEVPELRRMFLEQREWMSDATGLAASRVGVIAETVWTTDGVHPVLAVHLLPLGRLDQVLDLRGKVEEVGSVFPPLRHSGYSWEYNADGIRIFTPGTDCSVFSYTQLMRNGGVEFASLGFGEPQRPGNQFQRVFGDTVLVQLRKRIPESLVSLRAKLAVEPPYSVHITIAKLCDARLAVEIDRFQSAAAHPISPKTLCLPPFVVDDPESFDHEALNRALDVLWQSAGHPGVPRPPSSQSV